MMKNIIRTAMIILAFFTLAGSAWPEESIEIPTKAQQVFQHKLRTFLASKEKVQKQLKHVSAEDVRRLRAFHEAGSSEERDAAARAMGRAMLARISSLTQPLDEYSASIKDLRKALIAMAKVARVRKTRTSLTTGQFNHSMVSYEVIARELARIQPGGSAARLYGLASQLANKHRIRIANRNRFHGSSATGGTTTGMISDLSEDLHVSEEQLIALAGTLKEMLRGIQEAHTFRNIRGMRSKLDQISSLGSGLAAAYLGGYGEGLDHMSRGGAAADASGQFGASYEGQAFPRISQSGLQVEE